MNPNNILDNIVKREISVEDVVVDRVFESSEQAAEVVRLLSRAAVELGMSSLVSRLGQVESIATHAPDAHEDVPEVMPVLKEKVGVICN